MFENMMSQKLIEWVWVIASIGVVLFGLLMMFAGGGFFGFVMAVIYIALGLLMVRIIAEAMILAFKAFETNRRSLAVLEQMASEQYVTRNAIQSFLTHVAKPEVSSAPATASALQAPASSSSGVMTNAGKPPASQAEYGDQMTAARQELQEKARDRKADSISKLGDWPGTS